MHDVEAVQVLECQQKLPDDLDNLLFLEDAELLLEVEEGIFSIFHNQIDVRFRGISVVQLDDIVVLQMVQKLDLPEKILPDLGRVLLGHRFLRQ